jgi:8-oxo-dGTP pyrophosphatase MutT (NUDIX family)
MPGGERLLRLAERLHARARPALTPDLVPVVIGGARVGRARPEVAHFLRHSGNFEWIQGELTLADRGLDAGARSVRLARSAAMLRDAGLLTGWRNELLDVRATPAGPVLGAIERSACRPLGLATTAVHLNAYVGDRDVWVARRAAHKQIDPGMWDNLVGGMVPAGETLERALVREAWEEAGIALDRVELQRGRSFYVERPVAEGIQSETIHVYDATLTADLTPQNQDGEADAIERRALADVVAALEGDEFTLESALVMLESLTRRDAVRTPAGLYFD